MTPSRRLDSLDFLRAAAVAMVVVHHMPLGFGWLPAPLAGVVERVVSAGWVGVDLFFVLSGFLVSSLLFREARDTGRIAVGRFLVRRGLKIYPAFYALLL